MDLRVTLNVTDIRVHDKRQVVIIYFVSDSGLYVMRLRGDDIHNLPHTLTNVAIIFCNNVCLMNDGVTVKRCFPLLHGRISLNALSSIVKHSAEILPHEFIRDLPFEEGVRGIYLHLNFIPKLLIIFKIKCDSRIYSTNISDIYYTLSSTIAAHGAVENICFDRSNITTSV